MSSLFQCCATMLTARWLYNSQEFILNGVDTGSGYGDHVVYLVASCDVPQKDIHEFFWSHGEDIAQEHGILLSDLILGMSKPLHVVIIVLMIVYKSLLTMLGLL